MPTPTPFVPLRALQTWYDTTTVAQVTINLYLLDATATAMQDGYDSVDDLPGLLPTTGNYDSTTGIVAGDWPLHYDTDAAVMELSLPSEGWVSPHDYSLSFRWIAIVLPGGIPLTVMDYGVAQTVTAAPLQLYADESADIPNSYPVFRWKKA